MQHGTAAALTLIRVGRGAAEPSEAQIREALASDRAKLHLGQNGCAPDFDIVGPYPVEIDGQLFDEYVVWER